MVTATEAKLPSLNRNYSSNQYGKKDDRSGIRLTRHLRS
jgi:hypothetical protein